MWMISQTCTPCRGKLAPPLCMPCCMKMLSGRFPVLLIWPRGGKRGVLGYQAVLGRGPSHDEPCLHEFLLP